MAYSLGSQLEQISQSIYTFNMSFGSSSSSSGVKHYCNAVDDDNDLDFSSC